MRYFNKMLTYRQHVETTALKNKHLKAMAAKDNTTSLHSIKVWGSVSWTMD